MACELQWAGDKTVVCLQSHSHKTPKKVFFLAKTATLDANVFALGFIHRAMPTPTSFSCSPGERQGAALGSGAGKKNLDLKYWQQLLLSTLYLPGASGGDFPT